MQDNYEIAGEPVDYFDQRVEGCVIRAYTAKSGAPAGEVWPNTRDRWVMPLPTADPVVVLVTLPGGEMRWCGPYHPVQKGVEFSAQTKILINPVPPEMCRPIRSSRSKDVAHAG